MKLEEAKLAASKDAQAVVESAKQNVQRTEKSLTEAKAEVAAAVVGLIDATEENRKELEQAAKDAAANVSSAEKEVDEARVVADAATIQLNKMQVAAE